MAIDTNTLVEFTKVLKENDNSRTPEVLDFINKHEADQETYKILNTILKVQEDIKAGKFNFANSSDQE